MRNFDLKPNDSFTSLRLWLYDPIELGAVTLFSNRGCSGYSSAFFASSELYERHFYPLNSLEQLGFKKKEASSVAIPYGYAVYLYDKYGFLNTPLHIDGPFYEDNTLRHSCINLESFNDYTVSLEVVKTAQLGKARSYWRSITQTETLNFNISYGVNYKRNESTKTTLQKAMSYEMRAGFFFFGSKIDGKYSETIMNDIQESYSADFKVNYSISCTAKPGEPGVGLWQWVTDSGDGQISVHSPHTVCRYGDLYNQMPKCPWNACLSSSPDCSECENDWIEVDDQISPFDLMSAKTDFVVPNYFNVLFASVIIVAAIFFIVKFCRRNTKAISDQPETSGATDFKMSQSPQPQE